MAALVLAVVGVVGVFGPWLAGPRLCADSSSPARAPVCLAALGLPEEMLRLIPQAVTAAVWPAPIGTTLRVSASGATQADAQSLASGISADGRYVFFVSQAANLGGGSSGLWQVYRHDNSTGVTDLASVGYDALPGADSSFGGTCSADGLHVAFFGYASNIVAGLPPANAAVFTHDMVSGDNQIASLYDGTTTPAADASSPSMSANGQRVVFTSSDPSVVSGIAGLRFRIFLRDFGSGHTTLISSSSSGTDGNASSDLAAVSADGTRVAFDSLATNLVTGANNGKLQVYVKNISTGEVKLASATAGGTQGTDDSGLVTVGAVNQREPATISSDGTYAAFTSKATNLVTGGNGQQHVYRKNLVTGAIEIVSQVETAPGEWTQGNGTSNAPSISADGRYVAFVSKATDLVTPATPVGSQHVFVRDMDTGKVQIASVNSAGVRAAGASFLSLISSDARAVAFSSDAANLVVADTNAARDAFVHILGTQTGLEGDVNGDGVVDVNDLTTMVDEWKTQTHNPYVSHTGTGGNTIDADVNGDGDLNLDDVELLLGKLLPLGL